MARLAVDFGAAAGPELVLRAADLARLYLVLGEQLLRTEPPAQRRRPPPLRAAPAAQLELPLAGAAPDAQAQVGAAARR